jgi:Fic family protein
MRLTKRWIAKFIYNSNGIENIDTPEEVVMEYLQDRTRPAHLYIKNQVDCIEWIKKNKHLKPSPSSIRELHGILLKDIDRFAGVYRPFQVFVGRHVPPKAETVYYHVDNWCNLWGKSPVKSWSTKKAALFRHYEFEWVHPFSDGNGRVGRLLLLWDCLHHKTSMDIIEVERSKRKEYYDNLSHYQRNLRDAYITEWR